MRRMVGDRDVRLEVDRQERDIAAEWAWWACNVRPLQCREKGSCDDGSDELRGLGCHMKNISADYLECAIG